MSLNTGKRATESLGRSFTVGLRLPNARQFLFRDADESPLTGIGEIGHALQKDMDVDHHHFRPTRIRNCPFGRSEQSLDFVKSNDMIFGKI